MRHRLVLGLLYLFLTMEIFTGSLRLYLAQAGLSAQVYVRKILIAAFVITSVLRTLYRGRIRLLGRQRPAEFYPQVDVVAVPSLWNDNLPGVVFEAFAFGKPVIGARRGGIPEMIRDGDNGWLVEPTDTGALAVLLRSLHARRDVLAAAAQAARAASAPYTDLRASVQRYEDLYREAISIQPHVPVGAGP